MSAPQPLSPQAVDGALAEVLAEPPFDGSADGTGVWLRLFDLVRRWYDEKVTDLYFNDPGAFWLLTGILVVILAVLSTHLLWSVGNVLRAITGRRPVEVVGAPDRGPGPELELARAAAAEGRMRAAVELAFAAAVGALSGGKLSWQERTPRQIVREVAATLRPAEQALLEELRQAHERACYAGAAPSQEVAAQAVRAAERLVSRAAAGSG